MSAIITQSTLNGLALYDTPTVCNVIELFEVRPRHQGYMNDTIKSCFPEMPPMVGFAVTATFRSMQPPRQSDVYTGMVDQIEAFANVSGPPVMVFQDLDQPVVSATFGEVMCTVYKSFGAQGLITSGAGRDLDQVEAIDFPVFTGGTICSHGYCHMPHLNVPVTVGGICIEPGMLLHGDRNGVTTIPMEIASEIPDACRELMRGEQIMLDYCRSGKQITPAGFAEALKAGKAVIDELGRRLRSHR